MKEAMRSLMGAMAEMKDPLLDKLHAFDSQTYMQVRSRELVTLYQPITYKTSERLISICVEIGMPKKGKKTALTPNDSKVDDLVQVSFESC